MNEPERQLVVKLSDGIQPQIDAIYKVLPENYFVTIIVRHKGNNLSLCLSDDTDKEAAANALLHAEFENG